MGKPQENIVASVANKPYWTAKVLCRKAFVISIGLQLPASIKASPHIKAVCETFPFSRSPPSISQVSFGLSIHPLFSKVDLFAVWGNVPSFLGHAAHPLTCSVTCLSFSVTKMDVPRICGRARQYSSDEWTAQKSVIVELYPKMTLQNVREELANRGFCTT